MTEVLRGAQSERIVELGHDQVSTHGLMAEFSSPTLMAWLDQLVDQGLLEREGEYRVLTITSAGWSVLRSQREAALYDVGPAAEGNKPRSKRSRNKLASSAGDAAIDIQTNEVAAPARRPLPTRGAEDWPPAEEAPAEAVAEEFLDTEGMDLFDRLRRLRKEIADERGLPAYVVFADKTLRAMAHGRPRTKAAMLAIKGVGPAKVQRYGDQFLAAIREWAG